MLMSVKDVSDYTGISQSHIRRLIRTGLLKAKMVGSYYVVDSSVARRIKRRRSPNGTRLDYTRRYR